MWRLKTKVEMATILNILSIISSISSKNPGVFVTECVSIEWQSCGLIRKHLPAKAAEQLKSQFKHQPNVLVGWLWTNMAGRVNECTNYSWQFTNIWLFSSHTDSSLIQHLLMWQFIFGYTGEHLQSNKLEEVPLLCREMCLMYTHQNMQQKLNI